LHGGRANFVPEELLDGVIENASGVTDECGDIALSTEGESVPGFFRLEVYSDGTAAKMLLSLKQRISVEVKSFSDDEGESSNLLNSRI
jgi:hypothetical protein